MKYKSPVTEPRARCSIAISRTGALAAGARPHNDRGDQRNGIYQTEPLMDLKHMRPLVEPRLILGISLGLSSERSRGPREKARPPNVKFIVCSAPAAIVTLATLVLNPSAETETS